MADYDVAGAGGGYHGGADLAGVCALVVLRAVLGAQAQEFIVYDVGHRAEVRGGHADHHTAVDGAAGQGGVDFLGKGHTLGHRGVHLPVAGYNLLSHCIYLLSVQ